jgi:hypothetical protein
MGTQNHLAFLRIGRKPFGKCLELDDHQGSQKITSSRYYRQTKTEKKQQIRHVFAASASSAWSRYL